jgi:hypothetical protein
VRGGHQCRVRVLAALRPACALLGCGDAANRLASWVTSVVLMIASMPATFALEQAATFGRSIRASKCGKHWLGTARSMLESIQKILPPGRRPRLLVVGDLILDEFLRGVASRISPEAPVPVLDSRGAVFYPGGAGNVAANLAALGCEATLCGVVGDDDHGRRLRLLLGNRGIGTDGILIDPTRPTTVRRTAPRRWTPARAASGWQRSWATCCSPW